MKAIIIDDERLARQELKSLLASHPEIESEGHLCGNDERTLREVRSARAHRQDSAR